MTDESKTGSAVLSHTDELYGYLGRAFNFFNDKLWGGKLPPAAIVSHRNPRAFGYYHSKIFVRVENEIMTGKADELALNPQYVATRKPEAVHATLAHEMCHHWQNHFGTEPSRAYHNKEWGAEMKRIGLHPSSTGEPGGKETGQHVSHYILEGGLFALACAEFLKLEPPVFFQDRAALQRSGLSLGGSLRGGEDEGDDEDEGGAPKPVKSKGRAKFACPTCKLNAWAKPSASLVCGTCSDFPGGRIVTMECADVE